MQNYESALVWFRRDLRVRDNAALYHALRYCRRVYAVFVLDREILDVLPRQDRRVQFIVDSLIDLEAQLKECAHHSSPILITRHAHASKEIPRLAAKLGVQAVFANHDYEPMATARDAMVRGQLALSGVSFHTFKDQVIFERDELLTQGGTPYGIFTPYKNAWLKKVNDFYLKAYPVERYVAAISPAPEGFDQGIASLQSIGFEATNLARLKIMTGSTGAQQLLDDFITRINQYNQTRDFPSIKGPSYLSIHLRFGTVSIRQLARLAHDSGAMDQSVMTHKDRQPVRSEGARVWLSELIWRDFYAQVLHHFPHVAVRCFKPEYDAISWERGKHADQLFKAWCEARTGYPIIDAAMRQLNQTGYMHNRLRMIVASFLTKDLGIDWRWGEAYFATHLNDFDLASNNGGWQWASSSGCDAQPYFRIFNPTSQSEKFDAEGRFIRRYLPELGKLPNAALHAPWDARTTDFESAGIELGKDYPQRLVVHEEARARTLERYAVVKKK